MPRKAKPFWDYVDKSGECWIWMGSKNSDGYGAVRVDGRMVKAHRFAWKSKNGDIPAGLCVCHRCDNPSCVNPAHLFLGTNHDNVIDRQSKGRSKNLFRKGHAINQGEKASTAKINRAIVLEIRKRVAEGERVISIAEDVGLHHSQVSRIKNRKAWSHV